MSESRHSWSGASSKTISSAHTDTEIKRAKLKCQQKALEKKQELEEKQLKLQQEKERLYVNTELEFKSRN